MSKLARLNALVVTLIALSACGSTSRSVSTFDGPAYAGPGFTNVLVVAIADSYNNRATYERTLASNIASGSAASATAHYSLTKKDDPIDRPAVEKLVEEGGFDAVLITRVLDRDYQSRQSKSSPETKMTRKDKSLFRYDYEELNEPTVFTMDLRVLISTELYDPASGDMVWSIETDISEQSSVGVIVLDAAEIVAQELLRDGLLAK